MTKVTQAEFGRIMGVSRQRVGQWVSYGLPLIGGKIDLAIGRKWVRDNVDEAHREAWEYGRYLAEGS